MDARQWQQDIDFLARELPARHKNLFFQLGDNEFAASVARLRAACRDLSRHEIVAGIARVVAAVGDSHTRLIPSGLRLYPLRLYWFADGLRAVAAKGGGADLPGAAVERIGDLPIADAIEAVKGTIPHENEPQLKSALPQALVTPEILHAGRVIADMDQGRFEFATAGGKLALEFSPGTEQAPADPPTPAPLYLRHPERFYWFEYLDRSKTIYFQYNSCQESQGQSFADFSDELFACIESHPVDKLVFDVRNNGGGNSGIADPFIDRVKADPRLNREGGLFAVIGRRTFSSAILNAMRLRKETAATLIGEPTGGKPNHYGEVRDFSLPNSQMMVTYSTKYHITSDQDLPAIFPDINVELSSADYFAGVDPVLARICD